MSLETLILIACSFLLGWLSRHGTRCWVCGYTRYIKMAKRHPSGAALYTRCQFCNRDPNEKIVILQPEDIA